MPFSLPFLCALVSSAELINGQLWVSQVGASSALPGPLVGLVVCGVICRHMCCPEESTLQDAYAPKPDWQGLKHTDSESNPACKAGRLKTSLATCNLTCGRGVGVGVVIQPHQARSPSRSVASVLSSSRSPLLEGVLLAKLLTNFQPCSNLTFPVIFGWLCWSFVAAWGFSSCDV